MVEIYFADEKVKNNYEKLKRSMEFRDLFQFIQRAFDDIENKPDCGIAIPKKLIPKEYIRKYRIDNLYKYDLPNAWRLLTRLVKKA